MGRTISRGLGLNLTQLEALELLLRRPGLTAGELARQLGISTGATTALVDHLERRGCLRRLRDRVDRRRVVLVATEKARRQCDLAFSGLGRRLELIMGAYTHVELVVIAGFLAELRAAIDDYERALEDGS